MLGRIDRGRHACIDVKRMRVSQVSPRGSEASRECGMKEGGRLEAAWFAQESKHFFVWLECRVQSCIIAKMQRMEKSQGPSQKSLFSPGIHQNALRR